MFFISNHILQLDTERVLNKVDTVKTQLNQKPNTHFSENITILPTTSSTAATRTIKHGAAYARKLTGNRLSVTTPVVQDGRTREYIVITDKRTPTIFINTLIIFMAVFFWLLTIFNIIRRAVNLYAYTTTTVAKIRNIERSPLTQSYLMTKNDDRITAALNHLGETIQKQIISDSATKENLYEFIEFFPFPIFVYDSKGAIHRANAAFQNEFSYDKSLDIFSAYSEFLNFLVEKMVQPDIQYKTFYFEKINSYYQVHFNPLEHIENRFLVVMNDVTQFQQIVQAHTDFIANVSHEFKTPLASINGFADILENGHPTETESKKFIKLIRKESQRLTALVSDTLLLTKQNVKLTKQNVNLSVLIKEILDTFEPQIKEKALIISLELAEIIQRTDETLIYAIFKNLIENAIYYTSEHGNITIQLLTLKNHTTFQVTDTGPGLTELQKTRIFERFYRTDEGKSNNSGTGLGLAIVQKNVQDLGGHVIVESKQGIGSTFIVTL